MKFDQLSPEAKQQAINDYREGGIDFSFEQECIFDEAKEIAEIIGIDIDQIYYSGFCSQGDGACFVGRWEYRKGSVKEIKGFAPLDPELHRIASELQKAASKQFYKVVCRTTHRGHYYHEFCMDCETIHTEDQYRDMSCVEDQITEALRDFACWIYKQLEKQYDYLHTAEAIIEAITNNEYEYDEQGKGI